MKKIFLFSLCCCLFCLMACSSSDDSSSGTSVDEITTNLETAIIPGEGGSVDISITTNHEWGTICSDTWIKLDKIGAGKGTTTVKISVEKNPNTEQRSGSITIMAGKARKVITVTQQPGDKTTDDYNAPAGYSLVWHDEFNSGFTLGSSWTHEVQKSGWVNNELQNYVNGEVDGSRVTEIDDGKLKINCFKHTDGKVYSGRIYANVSEGWKYGYFEAKIKLPKGKGTWPAFWMMPCNNNFTTNPWPNCGEIDIMEEVGVDAGQVSSTVHCKKYNNTNTPIEHGTEYLATAESDFHLYGLEWTPDNMKFYVDKKLILDYANDGTGKDAWPFDNNFYIILNLAWGGDWGGYKGVDANALPVTMEVDYVRVFQKNK